MGAGLIGVWLADLRSRQHQDLIRFSEAVRYIAVFYDGVVVPGALILLFSGTWFTIQYFGGWNFINVPWLTGMIALFVFEFIEGNTITRLYFMKLRRLTNEALNVGKFTPELEFERGKLTPSFTHYLDLPMLFLIIALGVIGFFIAFALFIINSINKPIKTVVDAAEEIANGELTCTIDVTTEDEMGKMASRLNSMIGNLREWCIDWFSEDYYIKCIVDSYPTYQDDIVSKQEVSYYWKKKSDGSEEPVLVCDNERHNASIFTFDKDGYCIDPVQYKMDKIEAKSLRGGCFDWSISNLRPTYRNHNRANNIYKVNGFRLVNKEDN